MTQHFPVVVERESNGTFSAWVAGFPGVYAAADTAAIAKRAIRGALAAHLDALRQLGHEPQPKADLVVLRYESAPAPGARSCGSWAWAHSWGERRALQKPQRRGSTVAKADGHARRWYERVTFAVHPHSGEHLQDEQAIRAKTAA